MLKRMVSPAPELVQLIEELKLPLSEPQQRHVKQISDGLITIEGDKNLSNLYRHMVGDPCPKSAADTFREAPWRAEDIRSPLREQVVTTIFKLAEAKGDTTKRAFLSLDDSLTEKDRHSKRLESVDWHFDHARSSPKQAVYSKGTVYVMLRLTVGDISATVDIQLYLRRQTVRKLNRARRRGEALPFRTKLTIARDMLKAIAPLIPKEYQVYLLFDSWYASAKFIKWCLKRKWHVICRLKSNRQLDRVPVKHHHQRLKHRRYTRVAVRAADREQGRTYQVRSLTGRLNKIYQPVRVYISKRHKRDKHPRYYGSTDTSLSPLEALTFFGHRWSCEVGNWYIVQRLGWADCRLWRLEATDKFLMVLWLALAYLELRCAQSDQFENLAAVIRHHQQAHAQRLLEQACRLAMQTSDLSQVLERFTVAA
jgi:hypothetical protein